MKGIMLPMIMTMIVNLIYTVVALGLGICVLQLTDRFIFKKVNFEDEIKKGNMAAAVVVSAAIIFIAIVVSSGLKG